MPRPMARLWDREIQNRILNGREPYLVPGWRLPLPLRIKCPHRAAGRLSVNMEGWMKMENWKEAKKHFSRLGLMFFLGTLIVFAVQLGTTALVQAINPRLFENVDISLVLSMLPMYLVGMPIMIGLIKRVPGTKPQQHKLGAGQLLTVFCISYAIMFVGNLIGQLITLGIGLIKAQPVSNVIVDLVQTLNPLTAFFIMVLCAPVIEEFVFRKLLIDRTVRYGQAAAVLLSGLMFGLFHGNLNQFAYAFLLGAFWGFVYVKTGRLLYTIVPHMVINFMGSVVSLLLLENPLAQMDYTDMQSAAGLLSQNGLSFVVSALYVVFVLSLVSAGIALFFVNLSKFRLGPGEVVIPKGKRFSAVILNVGMVLYILFWIIQIVLQLLG